MRRFSEQLNVSLPGGRAEVPFSDSEAIPGTTPGIYVHGWGCHKGNFDGIAEELADEYRFVTFTLPESASGSMETRLQVIDALAAHRGLGRYALIGHSRGGDDASEQAFRHPEVIAGFASVAGSHELSDRYITSLVADMTLEEFVYGPGHKQHVARLTGSANAGMQVYGRHAAAFTEGERIAYYHSAVESVARARAGGSLHKLTGFEGPTFYIHGEFERAAYLPELQANPSVEVVEIPDAGHFPDIDNPKAYAAAIRRFMAAASSE